jgi:phenylpropionate dioxygenase-like ring-hydroxylating dioxygenase large terminal subunit
MKPSEMRECIPVLGLPEFWYPALMAKKVARKPVGLKILGEEVVFFRAKSGDVVALSDVCPHRGGSLSHGDCHYAGTVACPYHGWVFDEHGECSAVLSEGPDSRIPGKVRARVFPTRTLKGLVFIWMGENEPAAIEEDVPPEFFEDDGVQIYVAERFWPVNWRVAIENSVDSHAVYVHRNALIQLKDPVAVFGRFGYRPRVVNGRACIGHLTERPPSGRLFYPGLNDYWPLSNVRRLWLWAFAWRTPGWFKFPPFNDDEEWDMHTFLNGRRAFSLGHRVPSTFRLDYGRHMFTRVCVPIADSETRVMYYHSVRRHTAFGRITWAIYYHLFHEWAMCTNFSMQDYGVMGPQRYDTPEKLSGTDAELIAWRKMMLGARGMPDHLAMEPVEHGDEVVDDLAESVDGQV